MNHRGTSEWSAFQISLYTGAFDTGVFLGCELPFFRRTPFSRVPNALAVLPTNTRRVPMKGFCVSASSFPKLSWRPTPRPYLFRLGSMPGPSGAAFSSSVQVRGPRDESPQACPPSVAPGRGQPAGLYRLPGRGRLVGVGGPPHQAARPTSRPPQGPAEGPLGGDHPDGDRSRPPLDLDAEQWLRSRRQQYYFLGFLSLCALALCLVGIATWAATQKDQKVNELQNNVTAKEAELVHLQGEIDAGEASLQAAREQREQQLALAAAASGEARVIALQNPASPEIQDLSDRLKRLVDRYKERLGPGSSPRPTRSGSGSPRGWSRTPRGASARP